MTKTGELFGEAVELHLCNNLRHLFFALADALGREARVVVLYLEDDVPLDAAMKSRLAEFEPHIRVLFTTDVAEIAHFSTFPLVFPKILRRNLRSNGILATDWKLPILRQQQFATGYIYHPGFFASKAASASCDYVVMREAGLNNYVTHSVSGLKAMMRALCGLPWREQTWGEESWVDAIEVAHPDRLPVRVRVKARQHGFTDVFRVLESDQVDRLAAVFVPNLPVIDAGSTPTALILTQPLDMVGLVSNLEKRQIYTFIAAHLNGIGYKVYVKHHPIDSFFTVDGTQDVQADFPIELWPALGLPRFDLAVALCSASLVEGEFLLAKRVQQLMPPDTFNATGCKTLMLDWPAALKDLSF